jgi:hypothetical protein
MQSSFAQFSGALLHPEKPKPEFLQADEKRFDVYRNNVTLGLLRALQANFPAIRQLVGDEFFTAMAVDYLRRHPPRSRLLFEFGEDLPAFLQEAEALRSYSYLPDVARFEWTFLQSFHEADANVLTGDGLSAAIGGNAEAPQLAVHPAARLLHAPNAFFSIAEASRQSRPLDGIDPGQPEFCLITRPTTVVRCQLVQPDDFFFLQRIADGLSLPDAADAAICNDPEFDVSAAIALILSTGFCSAAPQATS